MIPFKSDHKIQFNVVMFLYLCSVIIRLIMTIYTIKVDKFSESKKLDLFLKKLSSIQVSVMKDVPKNPASITSIEEFQQRIENARKSVKYGKIVKDEELDNLVAEW